MSKIANLQSQLSARFTEATVTLTETPKEVTLEIPAHQIREVGYALRDEDAFQFDVLIDVCGVDYLTYGQVEWVTDEATASGFSRGVEANQKSAWTKPRFAVVYHLLSLQHNRRLRVMCFLDENNLVIDSVNDIWNSANWFEREAFDLFGILFNDHPDLRRILTDYGFIGHPFRKDFPVSGHVEMQYDAKLGRVVYVPVDIEPRVLVPKVSREDNRYQGLDKKGGEHV